MVIRINGVTYEAPEGSSIQIRDGQVVINGGRLTTGHLCDCDKSVYVNGNCGDVTTVSGNVNVTGNTRSVRTVSGNVLASHVEGGVRTVSGDIRKG